MKLFDAPGARRLTDDIALHEAKPTFDHAKVDPKTEKTEGGADYTQIHPKG